MQWPAEWRDWQPGLDGAPSGAGGGRGGAASLLPVSLFPPVGGLARIRRRPRHQPGRRRADLCRARQRRHVAMARRLPTGRAGPTRGRCRRAPRLFFRVRPVLGQSALRRGTGWPRPATRGGSTGCARSLAGATSCGSTISAASTPIWEIPVGAPDARTGPVAPRSGAGLLCGREGRASRRRDDRRGLGLHHGGGRRPAPRRRVARHEDPAVRLRTRRGQRQPAAFLFRRTPWSIPAPTTTIRRGAGWPASSREPFAQVADYFGLTGTETAWPVIRAALASVSRLAVVPMQDLLDLPSTARMNHPGRTEGNWRWRFTAARAGAARAAAGSRRCGTGITLFDRTGDGRQRDYSAPPTALPSGRSSAFSSAAATPIPPNS